MREALAIALQLYIFTFFTLCGSTAHRDASIIDDSDYSYGSGYYEYEADVFPMSPSCSEERLNELFANLPAECMNISSDSLSSSLERVRILCECGEPGAELFTECYKTEIHDPFNAVCSPTVNGVPCYQAFNDMIQELFVNSDLCSGDPDPDSLCPLPLSRDCMNALYQSVEELGCCGYGNYVLLGVNISTMDMLQEVCGFPQSVAYVCNGTTDPTASTDSTGLPVTTSDYTYGSGYYEYEADIFPMSPFCSEERLNELVANLPAGCVNISSNSLPSSLERVRILCECGEPGIELFTECYKTEIHDPFNAVCSPTVNGVPCYQAFNDMIQGLFVNSDICSGDPDPDSLCPLPLSRDCMNVLYQSIEELGCCGYGNYVLLGVSISTMDMLQEVCGFPQSVAYVCNGTTDPTASTDPPDTIDSTGTTDSANAGTEISTELLLLSILLILTMS